MTPLTAAGATPAIFLTAKSTAPAVLLSATGAAVSPETTQQAIGYPSLFVLVLIGALVPVVPTGALVSSAAVVAFHQTAPFALLLVFVVASLAAFLGDVALYWLGRRGMGSKNGSRWLEAIRVRAPEDRLAQAQEKLNDHGVTVLVLSRLVPAGRIPVMLACLLAKVPLRTFARGGYPRLPGLGGHLSGHRHPRRLPLRRAVGRGGGGGTPDGGDQPDTGSVAQGTQNGAALEARVTAPP